MATEKTGRQRSRMKIAVRIARYDTPIDREPATVLAAIAFFSHSDHEHAELHSFVGPDKDFDIAMARPKTKRAREAKRARKSLVPEPSLSLKTKLVVVLSVASVLAFWTVESRYLASRPIRYRDGIIRAFDIDTHSITLEVRGTGDLVNIGVGNIRTEPSEGVLVPGAHVHVSYRDYLFGRKEGVEIKILHGPVSQPPEGQMK